MDSPGAQSNVTEGSLSPEGREGRHTPGETEVATAAAVEGGLALTAADPDATGTCASESMNWFWGRKVVIVSKYPFLLVAKYRSVWQRR